MNRKFASVARRSGAVLMFPLAYPTQTEDNSSELCVDSFETGRAKKENRAEDEEDIQFSAADLYVSNLVVSKFLETEKVVL